MNLVFGHNLQLFVEHHWVLGLSKRFVAYRHSFLLLWISFQVTPPRILINESTALSEAQLVNLLMSFVLVHHLTNRAFQDLLDIIGTIIPGKVPRTLYLFSKKFKRNNLNPELHYFCDGCNSYIGLQQCRNCTKCGRLFSKDRAEKEKCYFAYFPLESQIRAMVQNPTIQANLIKKVIYRMMQTIWEMFSMAKFSEGWYSQVI
jgi:hypothetical protein